MSALVQAIAVLDPSAIMALTRPILIRNRAGDPILPRAFFVEEVALSTITRQLASAAKRGDDEGVADRFAALARTCVDCHSGYVHGQPGLS